MTFEEWFDSYCREIRRVYSEGARQEFAMTAKAILFQVVWDNGVTWDAKGEVAAKVMEWYNACEAMHCIHGASYKGPKITITESEAHAPATPATTEISTLEVCRRQLGNILYCCNQEPPILVDSIRVYAETALKRVVAEAAPTAPASDTPVADSLDRIDAILREDEAAPTADGWEGINGNESRRGVDCTMDDNCASQQGNNSGTPPDYFPNHSRLLQQSRNLCSEIENLPAGEHQTHLSECAALIAHALQQLQREGRYIWPSPPAGQGRKP